MTPPVTDVTHQYKLSREHRHRKVMNLPSHPSHPHQKPRNHADLAVSQLDRLNRKVDQ